MKKILSLFLALALLLTLLPVFAAAEEGGSVDFVVLSTTDMHGKCWDKNVLTDANETNTMLRVSTAVSQYRANYGENLLLVDNGDLYQGTPVSVVQLGKITSGESDLPPAMALCLAEIGYDVSVLGNHEFNYPWTTMSQAYAYLEGRGVPIVTANLYYDGSDGVHESGENVFTPYLVKTFEINGTEHKIGVLGFENTDCTRWDVPANYPGMVFAHPDNTELSMAWEAQRWIPVMQAEGCEFIIVSYHSGTGSASGDLVFGQNTEGQVTRMIAECEGIDMVIAGHDHSSAYSNTYLKDKNGKDVLVVNGGGTQLTQSVFTFSEDENGALQYTVKDSKNLGLSAFAVDTALKEQIQPYADMAVEYVNQTAGTAVGEWDTSSNYYLEQTDTMDLINGAQIDYGTKYMALKYDTDEKKAALYAATGLDHIEVDMSSTSAVTNNNYYVKPGPISMKTIIQMYKYDNNVLYLLPLTGQQIKNILEQNASTRLKASVKNGTVTYSTIGENFTNPVFGGLNFTYDMYQEPGSRAVITGFSNGRAFELDKTYVVACNSYHLGNPGCGFGNYTTSDSVWNQNDDLAGGNVQEVLLEYIQDKGEISTEPFTWEWKLDYTGSLDAPTELTGAFAAQKVTDPASLANGDRIVIYYDAECTVIGHEKAADDRRLAAVDTVMVGDYVSASDEAAIFELEWIEGAEGRFRLKAEQGWLTAGTTGNSLGFSESFDPDAGENDCTAWYLTAVQGGYHIMSVGAAYNGNHNQAIEWYSGFTTYGVKDTAIYLFNLYKVADTAKRVSELTDGRQYAIYFDEEGLTVSDQEKSGGLDGVTNTVSGDFLMLPAAEHTLLVTAHIDGGRIDFETAGGQHLTSNPTGNGLKLTEGLADNDCSLWTLVPVEGGFHVMNVGAAYNGNHNQALEYYGGKFTTYGVNNTGAYLFNFYELPEAADPCADGHTWDEGAVTAEPTCTEPGEKTFVCTVCGETRTEPVAALGHDWDEGAVTLEPTAAAEGEMTYTCRRCGATRTEPIGKLPFLFDDVQDPSKFYYEPVYWAFFHDPQITTGTSDTMFSPGKTCTRGQVVTFLWRALGEPEPAQTTHSFTDVKESAYYYKAMLWAVENEITTGTSATTFSPNKDATRGQVVTFLWRALGEPEPTQTTHPFTDVKESGYYYKAMLWAVETGVTSGTSATTFGPNKTATRGHVVTFLYRAVGPVQQKIAMITESDPEALEPIDAAVWDGIQAFCEENGQECAVYTAEDSLEDLRTKVGQAVRDGCNTVVLPGAFYGELVVSVQEEHPDTCFLCLDLYPDDVAPMFSEPVPLGKNTACLTFREEQAGYLAGYAAVKLGYTRLGVLAGMGVPAVVRYGYGFIQGADQAARELGITDQVTVRHIYSGTFWGMPEIEAVMETWYEASTEIVFSCGGNVWESLAGPAKTHGGKIIGVDVDQAALIDEAVGAGTCVTSAMKDFSAAVRYVLNEIREDRWEDFGGAHTVLGVEKAGCFVNLPASTQWADGFAEEDCEELCGKLISEELAVSDSGYAPATEIRVTYEGFVEYD